MWLDSEVLEPATEVALQGNSGNKLCCFDPVSAGDAIALELAAAEMAQAAAVFVALEKEMDKLKAKGADGSVLALKDTARCVGQEGVLSGAVRPSIFLCPFIQLRYSCCVGPYTGM